MFFDRTEPINQVDRASDTYNNDHATSINQIVNELKFDQCKKSIFINHWGLKPSIELILDKTLHFKGLKIYSDNSIMHIQLANF